MQEGESEDNKEVGIDTKTVKKRQQRVRETGREEKRKRDRDTEKRLRFRDGQRETEEGDKGRWTHRKHERVKRWVVLETRVCLGDRCMVAGGRWPHEAAVGSRWE